MFNSPLILAIILAVVLIGLAYMLGQFIMKSESAHGKALTIGFDFLAILLVNILLAAFTIRYVAHIGDDTLRFIGSLCLTILFIISMQTVRNYFSQHKTFSKILWEVCVFGIFPYPLFVVELSLHHYGSVRTISYVEGAAPTTFIMFFLGVYFALKFYARVLYRDEVSSV